MNKVKHILTVSLLALVIFGLSLSQLLLEDQAVSRSERRKLAQAPAFRVQSVVDGSYVEDLEAYLLDQFPLREQFRALKAGLRFYLFRQLDNNNLYLHEGAVFKMDYPLQEKQVLYGAKKINQVCADYLDEQNIYYAVIPDKNYFAATASGHLSLDYDRLIAMLSENLSSLQPVDLFEVLTLEDYYRTDTHWRQNCIFPVVERLGEAMGLVDALLPESAYRQHTLSPFYGVYMGQAALPVQPDALTYLTSAVTEAAIVQGVEFDGELPVYTLERFDGLDGYDIFLNGAQSVLTVENPLAETDRQLILFRDSFGSSLTPLLLSAYSRITLVDLRYISSTLLAEYVDFDAADDVLFLYTTALWNSAGILK